MLYADDNFDNNFGRSLEKDARSALERFSNTKQQGLNNLDTFILIKCAEELERYLLNYVKYHKQAKNEVKLIETRRKDHWDVLNNKCAKDPMFKDLWDELLMLMSLESDEQKTKEQIDSLKSKNENLLK